jgi:hypothetical protein
MNPTRRLDIVTNFFKAGLNALSGVTYKDDLSTTFSSIFNQASGLGAFEKYLDGVFDSISNDGKLALIKPLRRTDGALKPSDATQTFSQFHLKDSIRDLASFIADEIGEPEYSGPTGKV